MNACYWKIEQGKREVESFIKQQEKFVRDQIQVINTGAVKVAGGVQISDKYKCKLCGKGLIRRASKNPAISGPAVVIPPAKSLIRISRAAQTTTPLNVLNRGGSI
jgi:hypothetical protein